MTAVPPNDALEQARQQAEQIQGSPLHPEAVAQIWAAAQAALTAPAALPFTLTAGQIAQLHDFAGTPAPDDALEDQSVMAIQHWSSGHAGPGWYGWYEEYPEEGALFLDGQVPQRRASRELAPKVGLTEADRLNLLTIVGKGAQELGLTGSWAPIVAGLERKLTAMESEPQVAIAWYCQCPADQRDLYNVDERAYTTLNPHEVEEALEKGFQVTALAAIPLDRQADPHLVLCRYCAGKGVLREEHEPVETDGRRMLDFLAGRLEYAGVSDLVARHYAADIRKILARPRAPVPPVFLALLEAARRVPSWTGRPVPEGCIADVTFNEAIEAVDVWTAGLVPPTVKGASPAEDPAE
jgi:hypothetical protein